MGKLASIGNNISKNNQQQIKYFGYNTPQGLYNSEPEFNVEKVKILIDEDKLAPFYEGISEYADNPFPEEENNKNDSVNNKNDGENNKNDGENNKKEIKNENSVIDIDIEKKIKKSNSMISIDVSEIKLNEKEKPSKSSVIIDIDLINKTSNCKINSQSEENQNKFDIRNENDLSNNNKIPILENTLTKETIYKYPILCPICYLYYPRNINYSKCCDQPICTECFTQIKRNIPNNNKPESSKCANCPFCSQENFGVYYLSPKSKDYKEQYETFVKAKELNEKEYQDLFKDESFQGKKKKDLKSLTEDEIITSDYIYEEWLNEKVEEQQNQQEQNIAIMQDEERRQRKIQYIAFIINTILFIIYIILYF